MSDENDILNPEEQATEPVAEETASSQAEEPRKSRRPLREFIDGTLLTRELVLGQLPFVLFLMGLAMIYIANRYHSESVIRQINKVQNEIKDLRSEHISVSSELMFLSKQSEVSRLSAEKGIGLTEATEPPFKISVTEE